jgi:DNA-binding transcriptional MerR regulator
MTGLKQLFPHKLDFNQLIFKIGEVSKMVDVSPRQLRYWEEKGYIHSMRDDKSSSRVFDMENLNRANLIKYYLDQGFTLAGAYASAEHNISDMHFLRKFMMNAFQDITMINDRPAVNLGYFDDAKTTTLYGMLDENNEVKYRVIKNKEEEQ